MITCEKVQMMMVQMHKSLCIFQLGWYDQQARLCAPSEAVIVEIGHKS